MPACRNVKVVETAELAELVHGDCTSSLGVVSWCFGRVVTAECRGGLGDGTVGVMELVFDRLARAACLLASESLPHTRGTE
jgi:hypothetical protein